MLPLRLGWNHRSSDLLEHAEAQQIEAGSAIHLAFDELESVDLPFDVALTSWHVRAALAAPRSRSSLVAKPVTAVCFAAAIHAIRAGSCRSRMMRKKSWAKCAIFSMWGEVRYTCSSTSFAEGVGLSINQTTCRGETRRGGRGK